MDSRSRWVVGKMMRFEDYLADASVKALRDELYQGQQHKLAL